MQCLKNTEKSLIFTTFCEWSELRLCIFKRYIWIFAPSSRKIWEWGRTLWLSEVELEKNSIETFLMFFSTLCWGKIPRNWSPGGFPIIDWTWKLWQKGQTCQHFCCFFFSLFWAESARYANLRSLFKSSRIDLLVCGMFSRSWSHEWK